MTIRDITLPAIKSESNLAKKSDEVLTFFLTKLRTSASPVSTRDDLVVMLKDFDRLWYNTINRNIIRGRKPNSVFIDCVPPNRQRFRYIVNRYIKTRFDYRNLKSVSKSFIKFDKKKFIKMICIQAAFHVAKFGSVRLYELQIAALHILVKFFRIFDLHKESLDTYVWCIESEDVQEVFKNIYVIEDENLEKYILTDLEIKNEEIKCNEVPVVIDDTGLAKPKCADDLLQFYEEGMTTMEFYKANMFQWSRSFSQIRKDCKRFGIDAKSMTKSHDLQYQIQIRDAQIESMKREHENEVKSLKKEIDRLKEIINQNLLDI